MGSRYVLISGVIFGVIAAVHAVRAAYQWPVTIAGLDIPTWISWIAMAVAAGLCGWAFGTGDKGR